MTGIPPSFPLRVPMEDALDAMIGFVVDPPGELGHETGPLPVRPRVCQPMGIVHGGIYA